MRNLRIFSGESYGPALIVKKKIATYNKPKAVGKGTGNSCKFFFGFHILPT